MRTLATTLLGAALLAAAGAAAELKTAIFAGGCFWCMEPPFDKLAGVVETTSGYSGGHVKSPTYEQVTYGDTGHLEVVRVTYDAEQIDFPALLDVYWRNVDPFDDGGQFCDKGASYRAAIFVASDAERQAAETTRDQHQHQLGKPIVTRVLAQAAFYPAEDYHQDYYQKNPLRYKFYRYRCGRDQRLKRLWGGAK